MKTELFELLQWVMLIVGGGFVVLCLLDFPGGDGGGDRSEWEKDLARQWKREERQWKQERRAERWERWKP